MFVFLCNCVCMREAHDKLEQRESMVAKTLDDLKAEMAGLKGSLTEEREKHTQTSNSKEDVMKLLSESQVLLEARESTIEEQVFISTSLLLTAERKVLTDCGFCTPSEYIL